LPNPRIIAGAWRGRKLVAPAGDATRPTGARARQAVFDVLMHASWAGPYAVRGARVLDVFAGTGAYGLEALSRGAAQATFVENAPAAIAALSANIAACRAEAITRVLRRDALVPGAGDPHGLVFLDPPYGQNLVPRALEALAAGGWLGAAALVVAELGPGDALTLPEVFVERTHGKARLLLGRF